MQVKNDVRASLEMYLAKQREEDDDDEQRAAILDRIERSAADDRERVEQLQLSVNRIIESQERLEAYLDPGSSSAATRRPNPRPTERSNPPRAGQARQEPKPRHAPPASLAHAANSPAANGTCAADGALTPASLAPVASAAGSTLPPAATAAELSAAPCEPWPEREPSMAPSNAMPASRAVRTATRTPSAAPAETRPSSHSHQMRCAARGGIAFDTPHEARHETQHDDCAPPAWPTSRAADYGPSRAVRPTRLEQRCRRPAPAMEDELPRAAPLPPPGAVVAASSAVRPIRRAAREGRGMARYAAADSAIAATIARQQRMYAYEDDDADAEYTSHI